MFCRSVNRSLTFEGRQVAWTMPAGGFVFPSRSRSKPDATEWIDESAVQVVHGMDGVKRGQIVVDETACFRGLPLPVAIEDTATNPPVMKALAPLRQVHVWENGSWSRVGDVQAGQSIPVSSGVRTNVLYGLSDRINKCFPSFECFPSYVHQPGLCKNCGKTHEAGKYQAVGFSNMWIVAALSDETTAAHSLMKNARTESRAVWLIRIPMPHPKPPAPGDIGDKPR